MKQITLIKIFWVLFIIALLIVLICYSKPQETQTPIYNMKIVSVGSQTGPDGTKFRNPMVYNMILLQDTKDSTLLLEIVSTESEYYNCKMNDSILITKKSNCEIDYENIKTHNKLTLHCNVGVGQFRWVKKTRF